jgi:cytosine/adenosine deaminase-related metal-dependent hydrolase
VLGSEQVAVLPGLVNAHHHSSGVTPLQQGVADDVLELWLLALDAQRTADPHAGILLSAARLLRSGVTSVVEVHSGGGTAREYEAGVRGALDAFAATGLRVAFATGIVTEGFVVPGSGQDDRFLASLPSEVAQAARSGLPGPGSVTEDEYMGVLDDLRGHLQRHPRIQLWAGPPGPQWVSDRLMQRSADWARRNGAGLQTHVAESLYEKLHGPRFRGKPLLFHLHELGVLGPRFSLAHGVWLTGPELRLLAETGAALSHNPGSNLRLRAGVAPLQSMLDCGVTVALGLDGNGLADDDDLWSEMRLALRLHRSPQMGVPAPSARDVLRLATEGGARLLGWQGRIGRLAPGHAADLVLVDLQRILWPWTAPEADPLELLLGRAQARDVRTVLIGGEIVLEDGRPTRFDVDAAARELAERLAAQPYPAAAARTVALLRPYLQAHYAAWDIPALQPYIPQSSRL